MLVRRRWLSTVRWVLAGLLVVAPAAPAWAVESAAARSGNLDPTFGGMGTVRTDVTGVGDTDAASGGLFVQADGKIVTAGHAETVDFALARYNRNGTLDTTFGAGGTVRTDLGAGSSDMVFAVAGQPDGKILAAGTSGADGRFKFALARYDQRGRLDPSFGTGGIVLTDFGTDGYDQALAVAVQPDGRIVAAGRSDGGPSTDVALARYDGRGRLDPSFGTGGTVVTDFSGTGNSSDIAEAVALRPDGTIVVAGHSEVLGFTSDFAVAQYDRRGRLDPSFGDGGTVVTDIRAAGTGDWAADMAVQPDGKIVVVGNSYASGPDFALVRYDRRGRLDPSFGTGGTVLTDIRNAGYYDGAAGVTVQSNGKILVAGSSHAADASSSADFALARYDRRGRLDPSFGTGGTVLTDFSGTGSYDWAADMAVQPDGKIVVAGSSDAAGNQNLSTDFAVARYVA